MSTFHGQGSEPMARPTNVEDVEELILRFYNTSADSTERSNIDHVLVELQKSPEGFQIADALLKSSHAEVRFYGARTFIVKINRDLKSLDESGRTELLDRLLEWLLKASAQGYDRSTILKLCSCLSAYFINSEGQWEGFISDLINLFLAHNVVHGPAGLGVSISEALSRFDSHEAMILLNYINTLLEEVALMDVETARFANYNEAVARNTELITQILRQQMTTIEKFGDEHAESTVRTYLKMILWARNAPHHATGAMASLRTLAPIVLALYEHERLHEVSKDFLVDLMTDFPDFFTDDLIDTVTTLLVGAFTDRLLREVVEEPEGHENVATGEMLLAFGEAQLQKMLDNPTDPRYSEILRRLLMLTKCKGVAVDEDLIVEPALEFWSNLAEHLMDIHFDSGQNFTFEHWLQWQDGLLLEVVSSLVQKARYPPLEIRNQWDKYATTKFGSFRIDVRHFVSSVHYLTGNVLVSQFVALAENSRLAGNWNGVEVALFCLTSLSDFVQFEAGDEIIEAMFRSNSGDDVPLFQEMCRPDSEVPLITQKTAVAFLGDYAPLFQRSQSYIQVVLQCLFAWLSNPAVSVASAKSISTLCLSARTALIDIAPQLFFSYQSYASSPNRDLAVQEKLAGAVGAVIQACATQPNNPHAQTMLQGMLTIAETDIDNAVKFSSFATKEAQTLGLCALRCLQNIGKALRAPDKTVDLESDRSVQVESLWTKEPDTALSFGNRILALCHKVLRVVNGEEAIESFCQILRAGYTETEPGPFVFPLEATEHFLRQCSLSTPRIGVVLDNVSILLNKNRAAKAADLHNFALGCVKHVRSMIFDFFRGSPSTDPEVASLTIDFLRGYIPQYFDVLLNQDEPMDLLHTLGFTLKCLESVEILPKRSAAAFWAALIGDSASAPNKEVVEACITRYGPQLVVILVQQISGGASRSELDDLCEPLRKIIFKGGTLKNYFQEAMISVPTKRLSEQEKRMAAEQIVRLRGAPRTSKVVKEFWTACRGSFQLP